MNSWWLFKAKYCLYIYIYIERERDRQTDREYQKEPETTYLEFNKRIFRIILTKKSLA